jgi:hypothetical protein
MRILAPDGKPLFESEQKSVFLDPADAEQWTALGESAGYRVAERLRDILRQTAVKQ